MNLKNLYAFGFAFLLAAPANAAALGPQEGNKAASRPATAVVAAREKQAKAGKQEVFFLNEMSFGGEPVKGAPYSAEAVSESIQTLADGNRIVRRSTSTIYRDGEGRTRREQSIGSVGPWNAGSEAQKRIFINDPVAGVNFILNPEDQTAHEMAAPRVIVTDGAAEGKNVFVFRQDGEMTEGERKRIEEIKAKVHKIEKVEAKQGEPGEPGARAWVTQDNVVVASGGDVNFTPMHGSIGAIAAGGPVIVEYAAGAGGESKTESLGTKTIEGVEAEGTRTTVTIPAGKIGNELPIDIVSERWYSEELHVTVMTRHSDPRFGETTYRLTNVNRSEPSPALFAVPSGYTIEKIGGTVRFREAKPKVRANDE